MRPEHFHVITNLGHGAYGRARGLNGVSLFNRDGRGDAFDTIDLGLVHAVQELPRVRGEGFDVPALSFGKEGVESKRALARTAQAGDDNELVQWQVQIKVFQIIVANTTQANHRPYTGLQHCSKSRWPESGPQVGKRVWGFYALLHQGNEGNEGSDVSFLHQGNEGNEGSNVWFFNTKVTEETKGPRSGSYTKETKGTKGPMFGEGLRAALAA